ncbi:MAG: type II toxin-antitoxin system RelB/DinJ family antitoxin [Candidatus Gastranaerophilales bacterium]|nr:type II toxin-antitoxin system RelB/DinJ family antitoxin [Candidatus Gastranaerophilales bacterium]
MTAKTDFIRVRINPELKIAVQDILDKLGINTTDFITMTYRQVLLQKGVPFDVKLPNYKTKKAINDMKKGIDVSVYKNIDEFMKDMDNETD